MEQFTVHYSYEGNLISIDSDEVKSYLQRENFRLYKKYGKNKNKNMFI